MKIETITNNHSSRVHFRNSWNLPFFRRNDPTYQSWGTRDNRSRICVIISDSLKKNEMELLDQCMNWLSVSTHRGYEHDWYHGLTSSRMWPRLRRSRRLSMIVFLIVVFIGAFLIWSRSKQNSVNPQNNFISFRYKLTVNYII